MSNKYKKSLTILGILIVLNSMLGIGYLNHEKIVEFKTLVEANGEISVNYFDGKRINANQKYSFSITNNSNKDFYYDILITNLKGYDPSLKYNLVSQEANININNAHIEKDDQYILSNVLIGSKKTENFELTIENNKNMEFDLNIRKENDNEEFFFNTILKDNEIKKETLTFPSKDAAITSEGLIEDIEDQGVTYYFRGSITNNYVSFANNLWRIVRINGDGTVRLVLDSAISELSSYHNNTSDYEDYDKLAIVNTLNSYYESYLKSNDEYIANASFCKEVEGINNKDNKIYNAYDRLITNSIPSFNCLGEKYRSKIGLLTIDEVAYAGANFKDNNTIFYLYNEDIKDIWWTSNLAKTKDNTFYPFSVTKDGKLSDSNSGLLNRNIRPVINIIKKVTAKGKGTKDDPYTLSK